MNCVANIFLTLNGLKKRLSKANLVPEYYSCDKNYQTYCKTNFENKDKVRLRCEIINI